jgi:hypothetical protein
MCSRMVKKCVDCGREHSEGIWIWDVFEAFDRCRSCSSLQIGDISMSPIGCVESEMYYSNGEKMLCKCGKPAVNLIVGNHAYISRCNSCLEV